MCTGCGTAYHTNNMYTSGGIAILLILPNIAVRQYWAILAILQYPQMCTYCSCGTQFHTLYTCTTHPSFPSRGITILITCSELVPFRDIYYYTHPLRRDRWRSLHMQFAWFEMCTSQTFGLKMSQLHAIGTFLTQMFEMYTSQTMQIACVDSSSGPCATGGYNSIYP